MMGRIVLEEKVKQAMLDFATSREVPLEMAVEIALKDWAIGQGFLPQEPDLDENSPTEGNA